MRYERDIIHPMKRRYTSITVLVCMIIITAVFFLRPHFIYKGSRVLGERCSNNSSLQKFATIVENAKNELDRVYVLQRNGSSVLDSYRENMNTMDHYSVEYAESQKKDAFSNNALFVKNIGQWNGNTIWYVTNTTIHHRSVILQDCAREFFPIYTEFDSSVSYPDQNDVDYSTAMIPTIVVHNQKQYLRIPVFRGGNSCYVDVHYIGAKGDAIYKLKSQDSVTQQLLELENRNSPYSVSLGCSYSG